MGIHVWQVPCPGGCSGEVYCSDTCAEADWAAHHCLLCTGPRTSTPQASQCGIEEHTRSRPAHTDRCGVVCDRQHAGSPQSSHDEARDSEEGGRPAREDVQADRLQDFWDHAAISNDIFCLAAKVIAGTLLRARDALSVTQESLGSGTSPMLTRCIFWSHNQLANELSCLHIDKLGLICVVTQPWASAQVDARRASSSWNVILCELPT